MLYTSKTQILTPSEDYTFPLFWLRDSDKMAVNLHHVPWEHSQTFPQKELKDVNNARQVTSTLSCQPCDEQPKVGIELNNRREKLYYFIVLNARLETLYHILYSKRGYS